MKSNWSLGETDKEPRNPFRCRSQLAISMLYRWPKSFRNYFKENAISSTYYTDVSDFMMVTVLRCDDRLIMLVTFFLNVSDF